MIIKRGFRGNYSIKGKGVSIDWTPEMLDEYVKCRDDIVYFAENYFKIVAENGIQQMKLRDYQKEMLRMMEENRYTMAVMARQAGKTECMRVFILHYILFNKHKTVAIVSSLKEAAAEVIQKIQISFEELPIWLQLGVDGLYSKNSFKLENGSRIFAAAAGKKALRSWTVHLLFVDEAAHIDEKWDEFYSAIRPTIAAGTTTKMVMVSTPNGLNHFYEFYEGSIERILEKKGDIALTNGFRSLFVPWWRVPGRDEAWKQAELAGMKWDYVKFAQEYDCDFIGSSNTLISGARLKLLQTYIKVPAHIHDNLKIYEPPIGESKEWKEINHVAQRGRYDIYEPPIEKELKEFTIPKHNYCIVADVSRGKGLDYSAFSVFNINEIPYRQVAVFRDNNITPTDYAGVIHKVARLYNDAQVLVEINDIGEQVSCVLMDTYDYDNVLCTSSNGRAGKKVSPFINKADKGIKTSTVVKNSGCLLAKLLIEEEKLLIWDQDTVSELLTFSKDKNTYKAEKGKNDDLAMTLVLFSWLSDQEYFKEMFHNTMESLGEKNMKEIEDNLLQFGYVMTGIKGREIEGVCRNFNMNIPWNPWELKRQQEQPWNITATEAIILPNF